jgi:ABC-type nitrate/sulfonate/bicarbonate transport system permease component
MKVKRIIKKLFTIGEDASPKQAFFISTLGWLLLLFTWWLFPTMKWVDSLILPSPMDVVKSFRVLIYEKNLFFNMGYSISVNGLGYLQAIVIAVPLGFLIALVPFFRHLVSKQIEAIRFTPLPATTGMFMALFGIGLNVKVQFLAFGIFVYLLPAVVQRIDEIKTNDHS